MMTEFEKFIVDKVDEEESPEEVWWFFLRKLDGSGKKVVKVNNYDFMYKVIEEFDVRDRGKVWSEIYKLDKGVRIMDFLQHLALHYYCCMHNAVEEVDNSARRKYQRRGRLAVI